jgi:hypothetical protein
LGAEESKLSEMKTEKELKREAKKEAKQEYDDVQEKRRIALENMANSKNDEWWRSKEAIGLLEELNKTSKTKIDKIWKDKQGFQRDTQTINKAVGNLTDNNFIQFKDAHLGELQVIFEAYGFKRITKNGADNVKERWKQCYNYMERGFDKASILTATSTPSTFGARIRSMNEEDDAEEIEEDIRPATKTGGGQRAKENRLTGKLER